MLLSIIPSEAMGGSADSDSGEGDERAQREVNKAETLVLTKSYIDTLKREESDLEGENKKLTADLN